MSNELKDPKLTDTQIAKLTSSTKPTVANIRAGNQSQPITEFRNPTDLGLCTYEGISDDIICVALGESSGNALNWHYTLKLKYGDGIMNVKFDDWMIMQDEKNVFNKATMKKFGIRLGDVYLFFTKQK